MIRFIFLVVCFAVLWPSYFHFLGRCARIEESQCVCITTVHMDSPEFVTLFDMVSYIEVHVDEASNELCREIRGLVHSEIKSSCSVLKYHNVQFEEAFLCAGASCTSDPPHVAVVVCSRSAYIWKCTILDDQNGDLSEDQLVWFVTRKQKCEVVEPHLEGTTGGRCVW